MVVWLIPVSVYWLLAPMYVGGTPIRLEGGSGPRELAGLLLSFVVHLVFWAGLRAVAASFLGVAGAVVAATLAAVALLPVAVWLGFRLTGVKVRRGRLVSGAPAGG